MVNYRRARIQGGHYFFTVTLKDRRSDLLVKHIDLLGDAMRRVKARYFFESKAIVILPDHLHAIWQLPAGDSNYSLRWQQIKAYFTQGLNARGLFLRKNARGEYILWQRRFWEHALRNHYDYENHINYIHFNPIKHRLVVRPGDWPYSSFHRYVKAGLLSPNWTIKIDTLPSGYGE